MKRDPAADVILTKAGIVETPAWKTALVRTGVVVLAAVTFAVVFVWAAMALTASEYLVQLYHAGFDASLAWALFLKATAGSMTVAGAGLFGLIVGAIVGLVVDL